ncbi:hypothetical protein PTI98_012101 [Pleurotus ostreatus]|nr:hypothetical protein PTI98_012101 [Pleurotus ostreatus]
MTGVEYDVTGTADSLQLSNLALSRHASRIFPSVLRSTIDVVAVATRRQALRGLIRDIVRYVALFAWTLVNWVSFNHLINRRQDGEVSDNSRRAVDVMGKLLFAFFVCAAVLLFEKFSIQWIAGKFHERSYAERIAPSSLIRMALRSKRLMSCSTGW